MERARELFEAQRGHNPRRAWYYASSSSAVRTAAALRAYGLLEGKPAQGVDLSRLPLTYLAKRHLLARDNAEELLCLRTAALAPHVAKTVYREWPDLPASDTIRAFLISRMSFTARSVDSAVRILCENYAAAGLDRHLIYVALEGEQRGLFENA